MKMRTCALLVCAAIAVNTGGPASHAQTSAFDDILAPLRVAEGKCKQIEGVHAWSMQARTLYDMKDLWETLDIEPRDRAFESYECGRHAATVYLYQYGDTAQAQRALGTIQTFIWGEKKKSYHHPEDIFRVGTVVVVVSGEKPDPVTTVLLGEKGSSSIKSDAKVEKELEGARKAYLKDDYADAERRFRAVTEMAPDQPFAWEYLGHSLFYQDQFNEAIPAYERALELSRTTGELSRTEQRILMDQLGMAFGLSGHLDKGKALFESAIKEDPDYPMYYYNLACTLAELGDLDAALTNLKLGFDRKANMLGDEKYPNSRTDDSFKQFLGNQKFEAALKEMGF